MYPAFGGENRGKSGDTVVDESEHYVFGIDVELVEQVLKTRSTRQGDGSFVKCLFGKFA